MNGQRVRLVQIDTHEVYFGTECYGRQASAVTRRLLPPGTGVRLAPEPATDRVDQYGRLLRYVIRVRDGASLNVNVRLVAVGAAAPYFYRGRRGRFADVFERLARRARARHLGLWEACPRTRYDPHSGVETRR
jgi:micrococcal nuclease